MLPVGPPLILLRHGAVVSHRGDMPLTSEGRAQAELAGRRLAELDVGRVEILVGPTTRARQTGRMLLRGLTGASGSALVTGPSVASALRNPDLYLAGRRVDMVSTAAAFAEQVPGATTADVTCVEFFASFLSSQDRIGCWLHHTAPPGDNAAAVAARVRQFALSLGHLRAGQPHLVVGITHSPVLRAVAMHYLGSDPGEPGHLHGYSLHSLADGSYDPHIAEVRLGREVEHSV